jgi:8-oxo-dGTP pyrophosphatase MutT (NUDIX family)
METTRDFTATVYVVNDGAIALHEHAKLDMWLPPGGHVERDELPHVTARREAEEELGIEVDLLHDADDIASDTATSLPQPRHFLLEDINVCDGEVGHQHVDFIFYGEAQTRDLDPEPGEAPAAVWEWFTTEELRAMEGRFADDVVEIGLQAIDAVGSR